MIIIMNITNMNMMNRDLELVEELACLCLGMKLPLDIYNSVNGEIIIAANVKITKHRLMKVVKNKQHVMIDPSPIKDKILTIIKPYLS